MVIINFHSIIITSFTSLHAIFFIWCSAYPFRRNERIIRFFDNFKDFMGEEEMWQISEKIKPRGRRPVNY